MFQMCDKLTKNSCTCTTIYIVFQKNTFWKDSFYIVYFYTFIPKKITRLKINLFIQELYSEH